VSAPVAQPTAIWTDSHCHLHDEEHPAELIARARAAGVGRIILVGTDAHSSRRAVELAGVSAPGLYATVGLHPHEARNGLDGLASLLEQVHADAAPRASGAVVGIGECGLDYFYEHSPRATQREVFAAQIAIAKSLDLTLVVHTRDAWDDTLSILDAEGAPDRTVIHCFTGGPDEARTCLDLGCYLSFSGIVTFKSAADVREAALLVPDDRVLVETDAPYLAPVPHRGQRNEPAWVAVVGEAMAVLRNRPVEEFATTVSANTSRAFLLADE